VISGIVNSKVVRQEDIAGNWREPLVKRIKLTEFRVANEANSPTRIVVDGRANDVDEHGPAGKFRIYVLQTVHLNKSARLGSQRNQFSADSVCFDEGDGGDSSTV